MDEDTGPVFVERNSILRNAFSLFGAHFVGKLLSFALIVLLPRFVSPASLGHYFVAVAVTGVLGSLAEFGMRDPLTREFHLRPGDAARLLGTALSIRLTLSLAILLGCAIVIRVNAYPPELARFIWLLGGAEVFNGIASVFYLLFRARERMEFESIAVLTERGITALLGGGLVVFGVGAMTLFTVVVLGASIANLLLAGGFAVLLFVRFRPTIRWADWRYVFTLIAPYALANILNMAYYRLGPILLERWSSIGPESVAWYGIANSWVMALSIFPGAFMGAAFPRIARLTSPDADDGAREALAQLYTRAWRVMLTTGAPIALVTAFTASKIAALFYPLDRYPPGTIDAALRALAWFGGLLFPTMIVSNVLRAADRRRTILALVAGALVTHAVANAVLIPRYDHVGAALAIVLGEGFLAVVGAVVIRLVVTRCTTWGYIPRLALALGGLAVVLRATETWSLFFQVPVAALAYLVAIYVLRVVRREDWRLDDEPIPPR